MSPSLSDLTAGDALHPELRRVSATTLTPRLPAGTKPLYAVFEYEDEGGRFLGLVSPESAAANPGVPFGQLVPANPALPVMIETPLAQILERMEREQADALPVFAVRLEFAGAVTRMSLLSALFVQESLLQERADGLQLIMRRIEDTESGRTSEPPAEQTEWTGSSAVDELLRRSVSTLAEVAGARFGAIALLGSAGTERYYYSGADAELAEHVRKLHGEKTLSLADEQAGAMLALPITHRGRLYAQLYLWQHKERGKDAAATDHLVSDFAELLGVMLAHAETRVEQEQFCELLSRDETHLRMLAENALVGAFVEQDNVFRYINPALEKLLGEPSDALTGRVGLIEIARPDERVVAADKLQRCHREQGQTRFGLHLLHRTDGTAIDCEILARCMLHEHRPAVVGVVIRTPLAP